MPLGAVFVWPRSSEYQAAVMWYLMMDFPYVPKRWLKRWCAEKNFHFIPTHAYITTEITKPGACVCVCVCACACIRCTFACAHIAHLMHR